MNFITSYLYLFLGSTRIINQNPDVTAFDDINWVFNALYTMFWRILIDNFIIIFGILVVGGLLGWGLYNKYFKV